jgi:Uma2 family endonuclease
MSTQVRITVDQYDEMIRRGDFEPREENHVELIHGELSPMSPINDPHLNAVDELAEWSLDNVSREAVRVRIQGSIGIPALDSVPEPDIVWLRRRDYAKRRPLPDDVLLLIEVADSSLRKDKGLKAELYASAGIADYWIVDIPGRCVEVRRGPRGTAYEEVTVYHPGQEVRPLAFPDIALAVSRLFPDRGD